MVAKYRKGYLRYAVILRQYGTQYTRMSTINTTQLHAYAWYMLLTNASENSFQQTCGNSPLARLLTALRLDTFPSRATCTTARMSGSTFCSDSDNMYGVVAKHTKLGAQDVDYGCLYC